MQQEMLTSADIMRMFKVARSTLWYWVRRGVLPQPIRFSPTCIRWRRDEVEAALQKLQDKAKAPTS